MSSGPAHSPRAVRVECRKWPDDPHWEFDAIRLGVDAHGTWVGITEGTLLASPVRAFHAAADHVTLIPHDDWWLGTFYGDDAKRPFDTYVDIATPAVWHGEDLVRAVDLDLDVIQGTTGRIWVDDEDEFAAHRVALEYPDEVTEQAVTSCEAVLTAVTERRAPFDGAHLRWLDRLRRTTRELSSPVDPIVPYFGVFGPFWSDESVSFLTLGTARPLPTQGPPK